MIGSLGILAEAARRDLLDLSQALAALQATNFHAAPALIKLLLANDAVTLPLQNVPLSELL